MSGKIVHTYEGLASGVDISVMMSPEGRDELGCLPDGLEVTILLEARGKEGQPDHWKPAYRPETRIEFTSTKPEFRKWITQLLELL